MTLNTTPINTIAVNAAGEVAEPPTVVELIPSPAYEIGFVPLIAVPGLVADPPADIIVAPPVKPQTVAPQRPVQVSR